MPYRLPPMNALRPFEAAGRHGSFKRAAEELNLTPSAVSHAVQGLEDWLGTSLFARTPGGLVLTEAGTAYLPQVQAALDKLATAAEALPGRRPQGRLAVSSAPSFGLRWLLPRLPSFRALHPGIEVSVDTTHRTVAFPRDGIDIAIRMGRGDWPDLHLDPLVTEELVPVAAPPVAVRVRTAADLAGETLLHCSDVSEDWAAWARLAGVNVPELDRGPRFDTVHMALEAAAEGLGVAIGRLPLIEADLRAGRLQPLLGPPRRSGTSYWLATGPHAGNRPEIRAFRAWIRAECAAQHPV